MNPEILEQLLDYIDVQRRCAVAQAELERVRRSGEDSMSELVVARELEQYQARMRAELRAENYRRQGDGK